MFWFFGKISDWYLMGAKCSLYCQSVHKFWPGPAFWRAQNNHWPLRAILGSAIISCIFNLFDLGYYGIEGSGHHFMHKKRILAFNKIRLVTITYKKIFQFFFRQACQ